MRGWFLVVISLLGSSPCWGQGRLENPTPNSQQSGIGIISGWFCNATTVEAVVDNRVTLQTSYGTPRGDTQGVCGDINNGFGLLVNWNEAGDGQHTVVMRADGVEFSRATFTVKTLGTAFLTGISSEAKIVNFGNQVNVTVRWQDATQSFVIVNTSAPFRVGPTPGIDPDGSGPLPFCENPDAGRLATAKDIAS